MPDIDRHLSFFAALYNVSENPDRGMWYLYLTIIVLTIIVFKLGFSRKLPLLKSIVVYTLLILGCTILTFFSIFLPVGEGLAVAAVLLIIYKLRLRQRRKQDIKS
ncbi:YlaH-like family protein [Bacillaceae bacterium Marseille-Q3522]|nr:YlaH-like family protein [Bacillaceae bacterium Marseille-Q3522]